MPAPDYSAEYASTRARIRELLAGCTDAQADTVVPSCPAWTVRNLCAHLTGIAADLSANRRPGADVQAWVDGQVEERAAHSVADILDEWDAVGPAFEEIMRKWPKGYGGLVYDAVAHEHDLRGALGRPGARESDGIDASLEIMTQAVAQDLTAHQTEGTLRLSTGERTFELGSGEPVVSIQTSAWELMRLLGSRRSRAQILAAPWTGAIEPFIPALAHLPLPEADLVE